MVVALARFSRERNLMGVSDRSSARAAAAAKSVCEKGAKSVCETRDTTSLPLILMTEKVAIEKLPFKSAGARPSCV